MGNIKINRLWTVFLSGLVSLLFVLYHFSEMLFLRGRGVLNEAIGSGDQYLERLSFYPDRIQHLFSTATAYFPGVSYLAVAVKLVFGESFQEEILLLIAVLVLLGYIVAQYFVYKRFGGKADYLQYLLFFILITHTVFWEFINFSCEFKPDTLAFLLGTLAFLTVISNRKNYLSYISIALFNFLAIVTKQQYLFFCLGLNVAIIYIYWRETKQMIIYLACFLFSSIVACFLLLNDTNLLYYAIEAHRGRGYGWLNFSATHLGLLLFTISVLLTIKICWTKEQAIFLFQKVKANRLFVAYIMIGACILIMQLVSAANFGGGFAPNTSFALAFFMPACLMLLDMLEINFFKGSTYLISLIVCFMFFNALPQNYLKVRDYYINRTEAIHILEYFKGKKAIISPDTYVLARKAGLHVIADLGTYSHLNTGIYKGALDTSILDLYRNKVQIELIPSDPYGHRNRPSFLDKFDFKRYQTSNILLQGSLFFNRQN